MKNLTSRFLALALAASFVFCLAGCSKADLTLLNEKTVAMLDLSVERDTEGRFSMIYPGVTDIESYRSTAEMMDEYFPITSGYTWKRLEWHITTDLSKSSKFYDGLYQVVFDENVFYLYATWRADRDGEGFTNFQIVNEAEWEAAQNK